MPSVVSIDKYLSFIIPEHNSGTIVLPPVPSIGRGSIFELPDFCFGTFTTTPLGNYILDKISIPANAAWGTRRLKTSYTGPLINVRRSSDNATTDIFSVGENLDVSSLLTFVGAGHDGFVTKMYDQSGNGFDAAQATNAHQPQIVQSGNIITIGTNMRGATNFISANSTELVFSNSAGQIGTGDSNLATFARQILNPNTGINVGPIGYGTHALGTGRAIAAFNLIISPVSPTGSAGVSTYFAAANDVVSNIQWTNQDFSVMGNWSGSGTTLHNYVNGVQNEATNVFTGSFNTNYTTPENTLGSIGSGFFWDGEIAETMLFNTTMNPTDMAIFVANQQAYYESNSFGNFDAVQTGTSQILTSTFDVNATVHTNGSSSNVDSSISRDFYLPVTSEKRYAEVKFDNNAGGGDVWVGFVDENFSPFNGNFVGGQTHSVGYELLAGVSWSDGSSINVGVSFNTGDIMGIVFDTNLSRASFYKNGSGPFHTRLMSTGWNRVYLAVTVNSPGFFGQQITANFGNTPFVFTPPAGTTGGW